MTEHHKDCGWHCDQYDFECDCGAIPIEEIEKHFPAWAPRLKAERRAWAEWAESERRAKEPHNGEEK